MEEKIGFIKLDRKLLKSTIWSKPPSWQKIWLYILLKVNWADTGNMKRGSNYFNYEIDKAYLKGVSKNQWHKCIKSLKEAKQISTQKTTRGNIITVLNYAKYQDSEEPQKQHRKRSINHAPVEPIKEELKKNIYIPKGIDSVKEKKTKKAGFTDIKSLQESKAKHIQLIGYYFSLTNKNFTSPESLTVAVKRWMRVAADICKFTDEEINNSLEVAQTKYPEIWNLQTVYKILTK